MCLPLNAVWCCHTRYRYLVKDVRYSKAQKMLKFTFNALIKQLLLQLLKKSVQCYLIIWFDLEYLLWLRALHTAEKHHPTMFRIATVRPKRSGANILYNTSLNPWCGNCQSWLIQLWSLNCRMIYILSNVSCFNIVKHSLLLKTVDSTIDCQQLPKYTSTLQGGYKKITI